MKLFNYFTFFFCNLTFISTITVHYLIKDLRRVISCTTLII